MKPSFVTPILEKVAEKAGAELLIEPSYRYAGRIRFDDGHHYYFKDACFDINPAASAEIARDKAYSAFFLKEMGYPTIEGRVFFTNRWQSFINSTQGLDAACIYGKTIGYPVIIKPNDLSQGMGVCRVYSTRELRAAIRAIPPRSRSFLIQEVIEGNDYRIVILDGELICAYQRKPLSVKGDGKSSIRTLLKRKQAKFARMGYENTIDMGDARMLAKLKRQELNLDSVPKRGKEISLLDNANLSTGGDGMDVTSKIHPSYVRLAARITKDMGLRYCGVDIITRSDITKRYRNYHIVEVNASAGLDHYALLGKRQRSKVEAMYLQMLMILKDSVR
jgi:D-alanine-D-alanine ligase-like ATP-grasp enzyme